MKMHRYTTGALMVCLLLLMVIGCARPDHEEMDRLNEQAYDYHYRNLDSTLHYAMLSLRLADSRGLDGAEAMNHLAFVSLARMQYDVAERQLKQVGQMTNNQVELLVADVQLMRLCQRRSRNKDFYTYRESASHRLQRLADESANLSPHQLQRLAYAKSEFSIVESVYLYYVGLTNQSIKSLQAVVPEEIQQDTAQLLCYWYNIGAGGMLTEGTPDQIALEEFDYLMRCYFVATENHYTFWQAQSMQAMSEHLINPRRRAKLLRDNMYDMRFVNIDQMPDSLLAGYLAQRAYDGFREFGDAYQTAGADRTLAECYWQIGDYRSALTCLKRALGQKAINQAPDLVASIREQLSLVYSAVDDKANSDRNRNLYLDLQERTRQDRQLEARAGRLDASGRQLNVMLIAVAVMILVFIVALLVFHLMRRRSDAQFQLDTLLEPLDEWRKSNERQIAETEERYEEIREQTEMVRLHTIQNKQRNIETRAKVQLVSSIQPLIDRMVNEVNRLKRDDGTPEVRQQHYQYITELIDTINDYNDVLTQWIQMRQGEVSMKIESFSLQTLFDIVQRGRMSYQIKGINLVVHPTQAVVKADKTLTLFMINTMADNARKFTPEGGVVNIEATEGTDYVEIGVSDNGCGMSEEQLAHIFDRTYTGGHGFGLKNCNGIIQKYKKISRIFGVCKIAAESVVGEGTRISFRLPKGVMRLLLALSLLGMGSQVVPCVAGGVESSTAVVTDESVLGVVAAPRREVVRGERRKMPAMKMGGTERRRAKGKASQFADSAYFSNINGDYLATLRYADSCHRYLTPTDTLILLDISNETAVAALALHRWDLYHRNNRVYTRLFREASADSSLPEYVRTMQQSEINKNVAIILLVLLLAVLGPAYYILYYRYRLNYRYCIERINSMNRLLLKDLPDQEKLRGIDKLNDFHKFEISDEQQEDLRVIVSQIRTALQTSIAHASRQETSIELAGDELRRMQMDNSQLHISNSVLDNCLSTLKHETMYYPSRIQHLIDGTDRHLDAIAELASYYQELYQVLSLQALRQILPLRLDHDLTDYLMSLLRKLNHGQLPQVTMTADGSPYVRARVTMQQLQVSEQQCSQLFTPYTQDLNFMVCRQIVREMGEVTNLRACGMTAERTAEGILTLVVTMPIKGVDRNDRKWYQVDAPQVNDR